MLRLLMVLIPLLGQLPPASAQPSVGIGVSLPGLSIGVNMPAYPQLVLVPGYPVYYAPRANANFFFYDGLYWVFSGDSWYASSWYDGPWRPIAPMQVPVFLLRVPVRYYRVPPPYFGGWRHDAPPRWQERWGHDWVEQRRGWDHWDRKAVPSAAPLPTYQRRYDGDRYPRAPEQQQAIRAEHYRYAARDPQSRHVAKADPVAPVQPTSAPMPQRQSSGAPSDKGHGDRRGGQSPTHSQASSDNGQHRGGGHGKGQGRKDD
jgi:hypothetical protein